MNAPISFASPQIAEFTPGSEFTVFPIDERVRIAPMICYDATQTGIARGMAKAGANLGFVLANLGWFGPTSASLQFEHVIRFRAIENRIPMLFVSQNGRTVIFDALGEPIAEPLGHFTAGALVVDAPAPDIGSLYTQFGVEIDGFWLLLGIAALATGLWIGRASDGE